MVFMPVLAIIMSVTVPQPMQPARTDETLENLNQINLHFIYYLIIIYIKKNIIVIMKYILENIKFP